MTPEPLQLSHWLRDVAEHRDKKAFSQLFNHFGPKIQRVAQQKLGSEHLAMEAMQEVMTNIWRKAHLFEPSKGQASTWVYTVMRNIIFDLLRKIKANQNECLSEDIWPLCEDFITIDGEFNDHLSDKNLHNLVEKLPLKQQQVIRAIYFHEMTHEQLAAQLNIPVGTVKSRLRLALNRLKQHMEIDHD